ncbi:hypothetical protein DL771_009714 [Monosporascus sp. 5C6A]|nr:hypothetical protein DL771_009714 [Monosporascus sp. 5C6A]
MQGVRESEERFRHGRKTDVSPGPLSSASGSIEDISDGGEYGSSENHVFSDPVVAARWRQIYELAKYENRHRFDPSYQWTAEEELKLVRRIDRRIMVWAWLMFCAMDLHRRNINRAISDNMLEEIGMNTNDFNTGHTIFLLGLLMGGFIPDIVLWLTYFYKSNELPTRLAIFWTALSTVNIVGSLLAAGILQMTGVRGWSGWQWLFIIEGSITTVVGILSFVLMPPGPCQTRHWFRGKNGWFSEHEEYIIVNRLLRDDPSKGDMNNREGVGPALLWKVIQEWEMWPLYLIGLLVYIPPSPVSTYLSFILRQMGFSVFHANLLAIPSQFLFAVNLLIITWVSSRFKERAIVSSTSSIWMFPWILALVLLPSTANPWVRYALLTGFLSYPYCHAILVGWNAKNSNAVRTRAVSAALYNMFVQTGNIVGVNIYRDEDKPLYYTGNRVLLGLTSFNILLFYMVKAFYLWRNRVRDRKWNAMSAEEQEAYVLTTKDEGLKRLDFRFAH